MKKIYIYLVATGLIIFSCQDGQNKDRDKKMPQTKETIKKEMFDIEKIKKHIVLQSMIDTEEQEFENPYEFTTEDLDLQMQILYEGLKESGFEDIDENLFQNKLINIFKYKNGNKKCNLTYGNIGTRYYVYYQSLLDEKKETLQSSKFYFELQNLFFDRKYKIFGEPIPLKKLLKINSDNSLSITIPPFLLHRNKYLFNDNRDSFDWLIKKDAFFMESLVKKFGYTQDLELLEWVIKKTHYDKNRPEDYGSLFWVKNCDGSINLHSNTFKVLQKLYNVKTAYQILEDIKGYISYLGDEEQSKKEELTEEQRIKILANITYFGEQYKYTDNSPYQMMGRLRYFLRDSQVDILIKNKYFNLPKFKEWWDKADYDEYYVTECEYEGSCGPGYHPLSEKEWRAQHKDE